VLFRSLQLLPVELSLVDQIIEKLASSVHEKRALGLKDLVDLISIEPSAIKSSPQSKTRVSAALSGLINSTPELLDVGTLEALATQAGLVSPSMVISTLLFSPQNPSPVIKEYASTFSNLEMLNIIVSCISEFKSSPLGGISASIAHKRRFFTKVFQRLDQHQLEQVVNGYDDGFDAVKVHAVLVRLVPHLQDGGEGGWDLLKGLYRADGQHRGVVAKFFETLEDGGEWFIERMGGVEIRSFDSDVDQEERCTSGGVNGTAVHNLDDETLPDGFADTSVSHHVSFMQDLAVAAESDDSPRSSRQSDDKLPSDSNWVLDQQQITVTTSSFDLAPWPPVSNATAAAAEGFFDESTDSRLQGMDEFLETPRPLREINLELKKIRDSSVCKLFEECDESPVDRFEKDITRIISAIASGQLDDDLVRCMMQISRATDLDNKFWSEWFDETLRVLLTFLSEIDVNKLAQENCLLILNELLRNQTSYFKDLKPVFEILLDCRSDGSNEVSGSAEAAVATILEKFELMNLASTILDVLSNEMKESSNGNLPGLDQLISGVHHSMENGDAKTNFYTRPAVYQPSKSRSAFEALSLLLHRADSRGLGDDTIQKILSITQKVSL